MKVPVEELASSSKIKFEESDDSESNCSEGEEEIERELADVTFEDLQKARSDGSHSVNKRAALASNTKRANKNRPIEVSCSKPVSRFREVIQAPKKIVCDPRFESLYGTFNYEGFRKRYNFMFEKELPSEKQELQKKLKKSKDPKVIEELKNQITLIDKQIKAESTKRTEVAILAEHKKKEREAAKHGKRPFYLKKSDIRNRRLVEKYNTLKESGKLDSFLEKKRRKNAAKDHRYMPYRRTNQNDQ